MVHSESAAVSSSQVSVVCSLSVCSLLYSSVQYLCWHSWYSAAPVYRVQTVQPQQSVLTVQCCW